MTETFEPKIVALLCRWCASAGADLAGVSRMKYPENIHPIRVTCSGRMDPLFILRALETGADGVFLGACHPGDCHYIDGNIKMRRRFDFFMKILDEIGLADRMTLEYVSASEGRKFTVVTKKFTDKIRQLGPSPLGTNLPLTDLSISETRRKKHVFFDILTNITNALGYEPTHQLLLEGPEATMEGWGYPKRNPEKCIGCYTCYNTCPENVITIEDIENKRIYGALTHNCISCRKCEDACPEEALKVIEGFELMAFLTTTPLPDLEHELLSCPNCGTFFAPEKHVAHVEDRIEKSPVKQRHQIPDKHLQLCPECRRKYIAQQMQTKLKILPALLNEWRR